MKEFKLTKNQIELVNWLKNHKGIKSVDYRITKTGYTICINIKYTDCNVPRTKSKGIFNIKNHSDLNDAIEFIKSKMD